MHHRILSEEAEFLGWGALQEAGHEVTAFYLKIWFVEDFRNNWDSCPWEADLSFCSQVIHTHELSITVPFPPLPHGGCHGFACVSRQLKLDARN